MSTDVPDDHTLHLSDAANLSVHPSITLTAAAAAAALIQGEADQHHSGLGGRAA